MDKWLGNSWKEADDAQTFDDFRFRDDIGGSYRL